MPFRDVSPGAMGMAKLAAAPVNAFYEARDQQQQNLRRDELVQNDRNRLAWSQQQAQAEQQQVADDDAEWDAAYQAKDWGTMARLDPQTTKILYDMENPQQKQGALPASVQEFEYAQRNPAFQQYQDRNRAPAGSSAPDAPADQRLYEWFASQPPEAQAAFLNMKRSSATPEAAGAIAAAKTAATEGAKSTIAAQGDLPRVQGNASEMRKVLKQLKDSPGTRFITGAYALAPVAPGTPQADAYAVWEQLQGKAFLEAFNSLKGGGQITEKEGEKATAAITRLSNRKQSLASFNAAIKDLEDVVTAGERRAQQKAKSASGENDPLGIR